jgi:hypothetical protein
MLPKQIRAVLCSLLGTVLIVGCSDSALTRAEFIEQADAICTKAETKKTAALEANLLKIHAGVGNPLTPAQLEYQTKRITVPAIRSAVRQINALDAPSEEEDRVEALVKSMEQANDVSEERAENPPKSTELSDPYTKGAKLSKEIGFKTCFVNY